MTYIGKVTNGAVVLPPGADLPEGTEVRIETIIPGDNLAERYAGLIGVAEDLPADFAKNFDHYVHGAPKRA